MDTNTAGQFAIWQTPPAQAGSPHGPAAGAGACAPPLIRGAEALLDVRQPHSGRQARGSPPWLLICRRRKPFLEAVPFGTLQIEDDHLQHLQLA